MTAPCIVVPLERSEHARAAMPVARRLAQVLGGTIDIVHVGPEEVSPAEVLERIGISGVELRGAVLRTKVGVPAREISSACAELPARLVVMCTPTAGPAATEHALGGTAGAVLATATCPVVLVPAARGAEPWDLRRILVAHDGTPSTSAVLSPAADLARRARAGVDILHVAAAHAGSPSEQGTLAPPRYVDQPQHEWPAWLGEFVERLDSVCSLRAVDVRMWMARGDPGQEILHVAARRGDDLIALVWHGDPSEHHASTLKAVLAHARTPVIVFRARA